MARRIIEDEWELKARRVYQRIELSSNTVYNYKKKKDEWELKTKKVYSSKEDKDNPRSKEAVIKITSKSKYLESFKRHIEYITRDYTLALYDNDGIEYKGEEAIKEFVEFYNFDGAIPLYKDIKGKERNEVINFVFSMKEHSTTPKEEFLKAVIKTIKNKYPNNPSCFSFHGDTDNPHIHCDLRIQDINGYRINLKHKDRYDLRREFARNLRDLGIEAYATFLTENAWHKKDESYDKDIDFTQRNNKIIQENSYKDKKNINTPKKHHYEVISFGKAKYKFNEAAKDSFFVKYKTTKGNIVDIWSEDLQRLVKENNIKVGEFVKFKIVDKKEIQTKKKKFNHKTKKWEVYTKTSFKNIRDVSILGREEKDLNYNFSNKKDEKRYKTEAFEEDKVSEFMRTKKEKENLDKSNINKTSKGMER